MQPSIQVARFRYIDLYARPHQPFCCRSSPEIADRQRRTEIGKGGLKRRAVQTLGRNYGRKDQSRDQRIFKRRDSFNILKELAKSPSHWTYLQLVTVECCLAHKPRVVMVVAWPDEFATRILMDPTTIRLGLRDWGARGDSVDRSKRILELKCPDPEPSATGQDS